MHRTSGTQQQLVVSVDVGRDDAKRRKNVASHALIRADRDKCVHLEESMIRKWISEQFRKLIFYSVLMIFL